jgi:hypothetical protein
MHIHKVILSILAGSAVFAFSTGCKKQPCKDTDILIYKLNAGQLKSIYYKGNDSAMYISNSDTFIYATGNRRQYYNTGSDPSQCEGTNKKMEGAEVVLNNLPKTDSLFHNQYVAFYDNTTSSLAVSYSGVTFMFEYRHLSIPYTKDSLVLNGKTYYDVLARTGINTSDSLYYNLHNGIIRVVLTSKNKTLQLY